MLFGTIPYGIIFLAIWSGCVYMYGVWIGRKIERDEL
jgi:hypothetical protein